MFANRVKFAFGVLVVFKGFVVFVTCWVTRCVVKFRSFCIVCYF